MLRLHSGFVRIAFVLVVASGSSVVASDPEADQQRSAAVVETAPRPLPLADLMARPAVPEQKTSERHKDGFWSQGDASGRILTQGYYRRGLRQGKWSRSFAEGEGAMFSTEWFAAFESPFLSEAEFVDGVLEGQWEVFDARGKRVVRWQFVAGEPHGDFVWWYPNGGHRQQAEFRHGRLEGKLQRWNPEGKLTVEQEFLFGRPFRRDSQQHTPDQLAADGALLLPGEVIENRFDWETGTAETTVLKVDASPRRHGVWTWWYANGQKRVEGTYEQGVPTSTFTWWYENGQKQQQIEYVAGVVYGNTKTWDRAGRYTGSPAALADRRQNRGDKPAPAQALQVEHLQP